MAWIVLIIAGLLEACWAVGLKYTDGFRKPVPSLLVGSAIVLSLYALAVAARTIPIGTAYAIWVGVGVLGATILGLLVFKEPFSAARAAFLALLLIAILGLKMTSPSQPGD